MLAHGPFNRAAFRHTQAESYSGNRPYAKAEAVTFYRLVWSSSQFSTHFTNCISISAFL